MSLDTNMTTLTEDDAQRRASALATILEQMVVPELRRDTSKFANIRWLNRNLAIQNGEHPLFRTASEIIVWLFKWHSKKA